MEATIILAAFLPILFLLGLVIGGTAIFCVMTQKQILAYVRGTGIPFRQMIFYDVHGRRAGDIVKEYQRKGYRFDEMKWNPKTHRGTLMMSGYVAV